MSAGNNDTDALLNAAPSDYLPLDGSSVATDTYDPFAHGAPTDAKPDAHDTYAPTGPRDTITLRPKKAGYRGIGPRVYLIGAGALVAIVFAFGWSIGLFKHASSGPFNAPLATQPIASPGAQPSLLPDEADQSNALPVFGATPQPGASPSAPPNGGFSPPGGVAASTTDTTDFGNGMRAAAAGGDVPNTYSNFSPPGAPMYRATGYGSTDTSSGTSVSPPVRAQTPGVGNDSAPSAPDSAGDALQAQAQNAASASLVVSAVTGTATGASPAPSTQSATSILESGSGSDQIADAPSAPTGPLYTIWPGDFIPAMLDTGIESDIPGTVVAHVERGVYDSKTGQYLLIPPFSRLVGTYSNTVTSAQSRMGISWTMLILPNGSIINLDGLSAADLTGNAGLAAHVDQHTGKVFRTTFLLGGLAALAQLGQGTPTVAANGMVAAPSFLSTLTAAQAQQFAGTGSSLIQQQAQASPTLTVAKGTSFTIIVDKPLELPIFAAAGAH